MRDGWEAEARNWAEFAGTPGLDHSHEDVNLPALLDLLPPPGRRTLDLGCGEGRLGRVLRSLGHQVAGADASPTMVRLAAGHAATPPAVLADAAALPFRDEAFDLVVAYMCLHDMDQMPRAVAESARVLEHGGRLCLTIPHPVNSAGSFQDRSGAAPFVIGGSYLDPAPADWVGEWGAIRVAFHSEHRPLEAYGRALETAGLLIEAIREPKTPDTLVARNPAERRWQRIPLSLHLRAVKPLLRTSLPVGHGPDPGDVHLDAQPVVEVGVAVGHRPGRFDQLRVAGRWQHPEVSLALPVQLGALLLGQFRVVADLAHDQRDPGPQGAPGDLGGVLRIEAGAPQDLQRGLGGAQRRLVPLLVLEDQLGSRRMGA